MVNLRTDKTYAHTMRADVDIGLSLDGTASRRLVASDMYQIKY